MALTISICLCLLQMSLCLVNINLLTIVVIVFSFSGSFSTSTDSFTSPCRYLQHTFTHLLIPLLSSSPCFVSFSIPLCLSLSQWYLRLSGITSPILVVLIFYFYWSNLLVLTIFSFSWLLFFSLSQYLTCFSFLQSSMRFSLSWSPWLYLNFDVFEALSAIPKTTTKGWLTKPLKNLNRQITLNCT